MISQPITEFQPNALTLGCNQKTARDPVMQVTESEVLQAIEGLRALSLVNEVSGNRVVRFEHNAARGLGVPSQSVALLTLLALRGPQTSAELRLHTERLHRFADVSSVEGFLDELSEREPPLVLKLARAPGAREARWAQLLCGEVNVAMAAKAVGQDEDSVFSQELLALKARQTSLETELDTLRTLVLRMANELGMKPQAPPDA